VGPLRLPGHYDGAMISPIAAGPLGLTSLGADSSLLLKRLVQSLRQLSERV